ncbi:MAG: hypothetical protein LBQ24_04820 [Candidatus Peribacteria bacterium]|jgi:hypothetical protein|nr:hypothetical protein [Candidatus Peribacteria bacterium]
MFLKLLLMLLSLLLITIFFEEGIALIFGFKGRKEVISIILVNIITNPILNYMLFIFKFDLIIILFFEISVILIEWLLLKFTLKQNSRILLNLSIVMNFVS